MNRYEALTHAVKAHAGQVDKCGKPYILHPIAVAEAVERGAYVWGNVPAETDCVALLHDVQEDTDYLLPLDGLSYRAWMALNLVTKDEDETYAEYIDAICNERYVDVQTMASVVKLADLWHNLQPERQGCLPEKERRSLEARYLKARDRIWEALGYEWWPAELAAVAEATE